MGRFNMSAPCPYVMPSVGVTVTITVIVGAILVLSVWEGVVLGRHALRGELRRRSGWLGVEKDRSRAHAT